MRLRALALFCLIALTFACQKPPSENPRESSSTPRVGLTADPVRGAEVSGTVSFEGPLPKVVPIDMSADPGCRGDNASESVVVHDGKLANVFVYVRGSFIFSPPTAPVVVEQRGCKYVPHVVAVAVSQPVEFRNADPTVHNIHGQPKRNTAWNVSQTSQKPAITRTFARAESMIPVKCNQHPWMNMYVNVSDSPFFAVTDAHGHFSLNGIPAGTYDIVLVHETLGQQTQSVTLRAKEQKALDVSFRR